MNDRTPIRRHGDHDHDHAKKRPAPPAVVAAVETLQRLQAPPAPRAGLVHPIQHKLVVGGADDPAEAEAERVASSVVQRLRRSPAAPVSGCGHDGHVDGCGPTGAAPVRRHADHDHGHDAPIGLAGGEVDARTDSLLRAPSAGTGVPESVRGDLEGALGADLSGIRLHAGSQAADLNRSMSAVAFTHGRDVYFRDGLPDTSTDSGLHLLAHELTHTVQQGTAPTVQRRTDPAGDSGPETVQVRRAADHGTVRRHAAFEHYLLGQLQPDQLASIPEVRSVKDNKNQKKMLEEEGGIDGLGTSGKSDRNARENVKHLLDQEMQRLLVYRKNPEFLNRQIGRMGEVGKNEDDTYKVPIVVLTCKDGEKLVVSYSEMNTMPDLFGNPEAIAKTPKKEVLALVQGVRQQLYIELSNIRKELFGDAQNKLRRPGGSEGDFKGAQGPRSQAVVDKAYEIRTESQVNSATKKNGKASEQYFAALERNACHFAPQSWSQWEGYHTRALAKAKESFEGKRLSLASGNKAAERYSEKAAQDANEALLLNSFGEHYLQDSFASGHLIDKTKIMQWFTVWIGEQAPPPVKGQSKGMGTTSKAKGQWKMSMHAAKSDLESNPQALHDKSVRNELNSVQDGAKMIGMDPTPEIIMMMKWRSAALHDKKDRTVTVARAAAVTGYSIRVVEQLMNALVAKGFAHTIPAQAAKKGLLGGRVGGRDASEQTWTLDREMIDVIDSGKNKGGSIGTKARSQNAYEAKRGTAAGPISHAEATEAASEFNLASYNLMLSNAYIGASTKYFHDRFCKEGLEVESGEGFKLGRIYGDSNMLNAGGGVGLKYSAETSQMSREAVFDILNGGQEKHTTAQIKDRFPAKVNLDGTYVSVATWNEDLKAKGLDTLFKKAQDTGGRAVYKIQDGISSEGALDMKALAGHGGPF